MKKAQINDRALVIDILARSFDKNPSVNYIVRQDDKREIRIRALMAYSFDVCMQFGKIWLSDDRRACALLLYPEQKNVTLRSIWLDIKLIFQVIGLSGIAKTLKRESNIKQKQLKVAMCYLWLIGVDPTYQQNGLGSQLLEEVLVDANNNNLPIFLETSVKRNIAWYARVGFQVYDYLDLGYKLFFLSNLSA